MVYINRMINKIAESELTVFTMCVVVIANLANDDFVFCVIKHAGKLGLTHSAHKASHTVPSTRNIAQQ